MTIPDYLSLRKQWQKELELAGWKQYDYEGIWWMDPVESKVQGMGKAYKLLQERNPLHHIADLLKEVDE